MVASCPPHLGLAACVLGPVPASSQDDVGERQHPRRADRHQRHGPDSLGTGDLVSGASPQVPQRPGAESDINGSERDDKGTQRG